MRVLLLFRGSAGCGKSTYIEQHGLKPYSLCADDIRLMYSSPALQTDGNKAINQYNDKAVWNTLFRILETRMMNGEFTVIDATNSKTAEMNQYKELANIYRYRIYCIDMTYIPIEEVKRRNAEREPIKRVPDEVIDKFYSRFKTQKVPSGIKVIKPNELYTIWYRPIDLSKYENIHVIGDIHGCYTVLKQYIDTFGGIKKNDCYIFAGDYIDRGLENAEVIKYLCEISKEPNVILLEGNHEKWLWMWANDSTCKSREFNIYTKPQLEKNNVSKKDVRSLYRKLCQCCYFKYHGKNIIVTHGGISNIPENLTNIATEQMIKGVGCYKDAEEVDLSFFKHMDENTYQIHGHRNISHAPIETTKRTFNLEGGVEFGEYLRAVQINKNRFMPIEVKNNVFKDTSVKENNTISEKADMSVYNLVEHMRHNKNIYEKEFGRISSFNFTRKAFENDAWSDIVSKARGLYIDTTDYKIVARAYDKFFNINERQETRLVNLEHKLKFPVTAYVKENGFLGIVGWNTETDDLLITSKSSPIGDFSGYLKDNLYDIYGDEKIQKMKEYIKENNVSFVFECCDMKRDAHIIEYDKNKVVLLDIVKNQIDFEKLPYESLVLVANEIGFVVKEKAFVLNKWEDFYNWYNKVTDKEYKYKGNDIEGFVIEDSAGYMTKLKLFYYIFWKKLRSVAHNTLKHGNYKYTGSLLTPLENEFFGWCKTLYATLPKDKKSSLTEKTYLNICFLRRKFFEWKEENDKEKKYYV